MCLSPVVRAWLRRNRQGNSGKVQKELDITIGGVSVNKLSPRLLRTGKPDGLTVVTPEQVDAFVGALPVKRYRVWDRLLRKNAPLRPQDLRGYARWSCMTSFAVLVSLVLCFTSAHVAKTVPSSAESYPQIDQR